MKMPSQPLSEKQKLRVLKERHVRVLLIEDEKLSQNVEKRLLEELGCKVDVASSAKEALVKFKNDYELICMDIGLPDKDGYTLTREIRQLESDNKHIPIIAMTAHLLDQEKDKFLEAGMDGFVNKPITPEVIKKALMEYVS